MVGRGWRAEFFQRLARLLPESLELVGVVVRTPAAGRETGAAWQVPTFLHAGQLVTDTAPDFVVTAVPRAINPEVVEQLVKADVPVLSETPPATDLRGLLELWSRVGASGLVQVAEQYMLYPGHAARQVVASQGGIGTPTSVQVSSTHQYHAVSMIRAFLGVGFEEATVRANAFLAPLVDPQDKAGWTGRDIEVEATTTLATIEFASGKMGLYDFTDNQWHNPLRSRRIVIRGSRGEIADDRVVRLLDAHTVVESPIVRRQTGWDLNLEGFHLDHLSHDGVPVYRNPFPGLRLSDEDIAIGELLVKMAAWTQGRGEPPYPLAEGCQDHAISLAMRESLDTGRAVVVPPHPWAA
jgi:predicted dehydrogenase